MHAQKVIVFIFIFCCTAALTHSFAQDTISYILSVPEVEITDQPYSRTIVTSAEDVIATYDLGDVLAEESSLFIKDYGLNQLQSIQFRGLPPSHNTLFWNGVEVDNPFLRQMDLSLIETGSFSTVTTDVSGVDRFLQSGTSVNMQNSPERSDYTRLQATLGSFNRGSARLKSQFKVGASQHILGGSARYSENNFTINQMGRAPYKQANAALRSLSINSAHFWASSRGTLSYKQFYNYVDREIAPVIGQQESDAEERDRQYWSTLAWDKNLSDRKYYAQLSFLSDIAWRSEWIRLKTNNFNEDLNDHRHSLRGHVKWIHDQHTMSMVVEQMIHYQNQNYTNANFSYSYHSNDRFIVRTDLSRVNTVPSYNDLFWAEGGNPNIVPEESYKAQIALVTKFRLEQLELEFSLNPYFYHVDNWIIWLPGLPFWSPVNVQRVISRGFDTGLQLSLNSKFFLDMNYGFNKVTNKKTAFMNDQSIGKQLIYSPEHNAQFSITYRTDGWKIKTGTRYFSKLYTTRDNSLSLPGQFLASVYIEKKVLSNLTVALDVQNLTNRNYQVIAGRAQPPRYGNLIVKYTFK